MRWFLSRFKLNFSCSYENPRDPGATLRRLLADVTSMLSGRYPKFEKVLRGSKRSLGPAHSYCRRAIKRCTRAQVGTKPATTKAAGLVKWCHRNHRADAVCETLAGWLDCRKHAEGGTLLELAAGVDSECARMRIASDPLDGPRICQFQTAFSTTNVVFSSLVHGRSCLLRSYCCCRARLYHHHPCHDRLWFCE